MITKADFTPEQWEKLVAAPAMVWVGVASVDHEGGLMAWLKEMSIFTEFSDLTRAVYRNNVLIQAVMAEVDADPDNLIGHDTHRYTPEETVSWVADLTTMLGDSSEAKEFRTFLFDLAEMVAYAATENQEEDDPVSVTEAGYLAKLKTALEL